MVRADAAASASNVSGVKSVSLQEALGMTGRTATATPSGTQDAGVYTASAKSQALPVTPVPQQQPPSWIGRHALYRKSISDPKPAATPSLSTLRTSIARGGTAAASPSPPSRQKTTPAELAFVATDGVSSAGTGTLHQKDVGSAGYRAVPPPKDTAPVIKKDQMERLELGAPADGGKSSAGHCGSLIVPAISCQRFLGAEPAAGLQPGAGSSAIQRDTVIGASGVDNNGEGPVAGVQVTSSPASKKRAKNSLKTEGGTDNNIDCTGRGGIQKPDASDVNVGHVGVDNMRESPVQQGSSVKAMAATLGKSAEITTAATTAVASSASLSDRGAAVDDVRPDEDKIAAPSVPSRAATIAAAAAQKHVVDSPGPGAYRCQVVGPGASAAAVAGAHSAAAMEEIGGGEGDGDDKSTYLLSAGRPTRKRRKSAQVGWRFRYSADEFDSGEGIADGREEVRVVVRSLGLLTESNQTCVLPCTRLLSFGLACCVCLLFFLVLDLYFVFAVGFT